MQEITAPYLLCLGNETQLTFAKTAKGILDWRPEKCLGQIGLEGCTVDLGLKPISIENARAEGIKTLVLGVAPPGGVIPVGWHSLLFSALENGLDIASGLHSKLVDVPDLAATAARLERQLFDVRHSTQTFSVGSGAPRQGKRLLTVGTDCAVGKMYSALAIEKEMKLRGCNADFAATGQTGIFISGKGVSVDAVVSDFISGAAEFLSPENNEQHWDIIEGQGSLFHPSFAAVTLGLIHGSQPDAMILCHEVGRKEIIGTEHYLIPNLDDCMKTYLGAARLTNKKATFVGACFNTSSLSNDEAKRYLENKENSLGIPCSDPYRYGVTKIVDKLKDF
ncbi:MAG: putative NAD-dependent epimerase/dehydratase family protein [Enterobacterales bacterium]|jgi:uncharacterized NAD-dependent epimerase/dehydratase family protein